MVLEHQVEGRLNKVDKSINQKSNTFNKEEKFSRLDIRQLNNLSPDFSSNSKPPKMEWVQHYGSGLAPSTDCALAMAIDKFGNFYVTGSSNTPTTANDYLTIKYSPEGELLWMARFNGHANGLDYPTAITVDSFCNVYVTGCSHTFGSSYNYATVKYDSSGNEMWVRQYNGPSDTVDQASAITVDHLGNVYVTGRSMRITVPPAWDWDYATVKYNSSGDVVWEKRYNDPVGNSDDEATDIKVDNLGYVYVTGGSYGGNSQSDYLTIRYNPDGNEDQLLRYNAANLRDFAYALTIDASRNIYVTGYSSSTDAGDIVTIKYNSLGAQLWVARYNGPGNNFDEGIDIVVDNIGNVTVTGNSWGGISTYYDIATIKYNSQGNVIWTDRYNNPTNYGDFATSIAQDPAGNIVVTGSSYSGVYGPSDYVTIKYSSQGIRLWAKNHGLSGPYWSEAYAMVVNNSGEIYVTGYDEDSLFNSDYLTVKYDPSGNKEWERRFDGVGMSYDQIVETRIDNAGYVYVTGNSYSSSTKNDFLTIKYTPSGSIFWMQRFNGPANLNDVVTSMEIDKQGNVYVSGKSQNNNGNYDYVLIKYSFIGSIEWIKYYSGIANQDDDLHDIDIDSNGFIYVTGTSVEFGNNKDITTIKYNTDGEQIWVSHFDGTVSGFDLGFAVTHDDLGNVYVAGASQGADTLGDYITIKYNVFGDQLWAVRYDHSGGFDRPVGIVVDKSYSVYVTGTSFDPITKDDYATLKYDQDGNLVWVRRFNNEPLNFSDKATDITLDNIGNIYITGISDGGITYFDWVTLKYDSSGNLIWMKRYNGKYNASDYPNKIIADYIGNVYVTGKAINVPPYTSDILTIKYYPSGDVAWVAFYDGPYNSDDNAFSIHINEYGEISIGGGSGLFGNLLFTTIKYNQFDQKAIEISGGWNMISVPMKVRDSRKTTLFPTAISPAWTYMQGTGYIQKDTLVNGTGYWLKFGIDQIVEMTGFSYPTDTIDLAEGWNMVGSISELVDVNTIEFIPGDITRSKFFGYRTGYFVTDTLEPGKGYWVKVSQPAKMILSTSGMKKSFSQPKLFAENELPPPPPGDEISNLKTEIQDKFVLEQNYPNPFNPITTIKFGLPVESQVTLEIFNILGQKILTILDNELLDEGTHEVEINANNLASGVYIYRIIANSINENGEKSLTVNAVNKMVILK